MTHMEIKLQKLEVDCGGFYEYFLVKSEPRKNKILQFLFGDKLTILVSYGEIKPLDSIVSGDIIKMTHFKLK